MTSTSDRARLISFVAASSVRRAVSRIGNLFAGGLPLDGRAPTRLLIAPHDLRTTDPTIAADIYRGRFSLSGSRGSGGVRAESRCCLGVVLLSRVAGSSASGRKRSSSTKPL